MTIYFKDTTVDGPTNTKVYIDGNLSGYTTYRLQLTSRYTNRSIDNETSSWLLPIELELSNERYSQFNVQPYLGAGSTVELGLYTGLYDYEIWGTLLDIDWNTDNFDEGQWTLLQNGHTKVKSTTTVDMQRGSEPETVKYTSEPNTAKSYVIYK